MRFGFGSRRGSAAVSGEKRVSSGPGAGTEAGGLGPGGQGGVGPGVGGRPEADGPSRDRRSRARGGWPSSAVSGVGPGRVKRTRGGRVLDRGERGSRRMKQGPKGAALEHDDQGGTGAGGAMTGVVGL